MASIVIPENYKSVLGKYETQAAISELHRLFEQALGKALCLKRVSAPLFVDPATGLNDDLNGVERPVSFQIPDIARDAVIVHSLAKWKRLALHRYHFPAGEGLFCDMNAVRRDEVTDNLHSVYVDQWDWEKVITPNERTIETLQETVKAIVGAICDTHEALRRHFPALKNTLSRRVTFLYAQELEDRYPDLSPKERESRAAKEYGTIFVMQIGEILRSGKPHDGRAPDYDDWRLNGDLIFWDKILSCALEVSSMGIRVDAKSLAEQLEKAGCPERKNLPFHRLLLEEKLPLTMGGGIGQSRLSMLLLEKCHVGEVQASLWDKQTEDLCRERGILLL